jgi:hypothetical protein
LFFAIEWNFSGDSKRSNPTEVTLIEHLLLHASNRAMRV